MGEGRLRETASGSHRHLDSAAMFFCRLIKQPRRKKKTSASTSKGRKHGEKEEKEDGMPARGGVKGRERGGKARAWRWSDYVERKGTQTGETTGKKEGGG